MPKRRLLSGLLNLLERSAIVFALLFFILYIGNTSYLLISEWETEHKNINLFVTQLTTILGFGAGVYYFMSAAKRDRQKTALKEVTELYTEIVECRKELEKKNIPFGKKYDNDLPITSADIEEWAGMFENENEKNELERLLINMINSAENIALGIRFRLYDEEFVFDLCGTTVVRTWQILVEFIKKKRKDYNQPTLAIELELLHAKWWAHSLLVQSKRLRRQAKTTPQQ